jgi:uncharacterized membrane protein
MKSRGKSADNDITAALKPSVRLMSEGETAVLIGAIIFAPITKPIITMIIAIIFANWNRPPY